MLCSDLERRVRGPVSDINRSCGVFSFHQMIVDYQVDVVAFQEVDVRKFPNNSLVNEIFERLEVTHAKEYTGACTCLLVITLSSLLLSLLFLPCVATHVVEVS